MKTYFKITQFAFLIIAILLTVEAIRTWGESSTQTIILILLAAAGYFKFFFNRWYRKSLLEKRK